MKFIVKTITIITVNDLTDEGSTQTQESTRTTQTEAISKIVRLPIT